MSKRISQSSVLLTLFAAGATFGAPAMAQDKTAAQPSTPQAGLTEVIVTAQKRDTNLQKTPIAISVMSKDQLADRHIQSLADITGGAVPSLSVEPFFARSSALIVSLRGIGAMSDANQPNRDQGVGVYEDGVYLGLAQGLGAAMDDVDHIEVARGPEGTLFGRNTEGGAISIVTKKPTGVFDMTTTVGVSNFGGSLFQTHIDLPSFDGISAKIDLLDTSRNGTVKNPLAGQHDFNAYDKHGGRLSLRWQPRDDLDINYAYDTSFDATTPYYVQLLSKGSYPMSPLATIQPDRATTANFGVPLQYSEGRTAGHTLSVDWTLNSDLKFKSITSFRTLSQSQYDDGETNLFAYVLTPTPTSTFGRYSLANFWQTQASQEFQLIGKTENLTYVAGLFYYAENVHDNAWTPDPLQWDGSPTAYSVLPVPVDASPFPDRASHAQDHSLGAYAQTTWTPDFANKLMHLTFGGRLSEDHKQGDLDLVNGTLPVVSENGTLVSGVLTMDKTWSRFDPLVIASLTPTPDIDLYAKWDTGSKAGGANSRSLTYRTFNPESVSMAEIGAKTEFFDHRLRFNVDGFSGDYKDPQIDFNANFAVGTSNRATIETVNATGMGHTSGYEGDLTALITRNLTVSASIAKTDITMPQADNPFAGNVLTAVYALNTPRSAHNFAIDYHHPIDGMQLRAHLDANISDGLHGSSSDPTLSDKSDVVNGRLSLSDIAIGSNGAKLQVSLWSRNLGNEQHAFYKSTSALGQYGIFNEPRTYGLDMTVKY